MIVEIANTPRDYAWGSATAIAHALGREASGRPEAELWLGAHSGSPSRIVKPELVGGATTLLEWITRDPVTTLGARTSDPRARASNRGGGAAASAVWSRLPFLLKILAADQPLSLQAHPSSDKALEGFERENLLGIPLDSAERNYRDVFHKPELVVALRSPFEVLCGFRSVRDARQIACAFRTADEESVDSTPEIFAEFVRRLSGSDEVGGSAAITDAASTAAHERRRENDERTVRGIVEWLLDVAGTQIVPRLVDLAAVVASKPAAPALVTCAANTVTLLDHYYPGDPGIALSLLLNRISIEAGHALYVPVGTIHAYLSGLGVELMASSDNVLRGGLTPKHVDVVELLTVLDFSPGPARLLLPELSQDGVEIFRPDVPDFVLARVNCTATMPFAGPVHIRGPAIAIATKGKGELRGHNSFGPVSRGESFFITPDEGELTFSGSGEVFVATSGD